MEGLNLVSGSRSASAASGSARRRTCCSSPIKDGDDKPDGPPQILLDGWGYQDTHETLNTFIWGPDGWLYGCHGVFTHSQRRQAGHAGRGAHADQRRHLALSSDASTSSRSSPTARATRGASTSTTTARRSVEACVIPHCFHIIQGGRYQRQAGPHFNPYTYDDIKTIADHRHYVGANPHGGNNRTDAAGGGHAHCGLMIYLGGTWPKEYRGQLFMGNIHGRRINVDVLTPKGSGYVADRTARTSCWPTTPGRASSTCEYGPDGNVYLIDWYDKQACHHDEPEDLGPHQRPHLQDQLPRHEAGAGSIWRR